MKPEDIDRLQRDVFIYVTVLGVIVSLAAVLRWVLS